MAAAILLTDLLLMLDEHPLFKSVAFRYCIGRKGREQGTAWPWPDLGGPFRNKELRLDKRVKAMLLGLGFDCKDGHKRITTGKNFVLLGGSKDTHEQMQEKAIKFNEKLDQRGKQLEDINLKEFKEIARDAGMTPGKD
jgi:hypothetical protein